MIRSIVLSFCSFSLCALILQILSLFFSTRDLRGFLANRCEILLHGRKHVQFYNAGPKNWGPAPKKIMGPKYAKFGNILQDFRFEREFLRNG